MPGIADLIERVNQGVLVSGMERNVEANRSAGGRVTKALPVGWNGIPGMFHTHVIPRWWEGPSRGGRRWRRGRRAERDGGSA